MGNVRWNTNEIKYLKENYGNKTNKEIAEYLGRSVSSVQHKAEQEGLKSSKYWTEENINFLINNYKHMTYKELSKKLGKTKSAIDLKINRLGLKKSNYNYDYSFFNEINSELKAYWLGFIAADGCVSVNENTNSCEVYIKLQASDVNHLKKFNKALKGNVSPTFDERICNLNNKLEKCCMIRYYNKEMAHDLIKHNVTPNKSLTLKFPTTLEYKYIKYYIRGYFDGNGCIIDSRCDFTCASPSFINSLREILYKEGIYTYVKEQPNNKSKRVVITGKENMKNFLNYIYKDATIYLDRKFNRFKKFKQLNNM